MPRAKRPSDERYNERRRQKRAAERAARNAGKTVQSSDDAYNARRRYIRQAENVLKRAKSAASEVERKRLFSVARYAVQNATATYEKTKTQFKGKLGELVKKTGAVVQPMSSKQRFKIIEESEYAKIKQTSEQRIEFEAKLIMRSYVGSRIMASLSNIWEDARNPLTGKVNWKEAEQMIFDYFNTVSWAGVVDRFVSDFGEDLFADEDSSIAYDELVTAALVQYV